MNHLRVAIAVCTATCLLAGCATMPSQGPGGPAAVSGGDGGLLAGLKLPGLGGGYATTFTILAMEATGPDASERVELMARGLRQVQGLDASQVRTDHQPGRSRLYYGSYRGVPNKAADKFDIPEQARREHAFIRDLGSGSLQPFLFARIVAAPTPHVGPPEWDLRNAPGSHTLQISYCFDKPGLPNHKEMAVSIVRTLREQGEEAWYFHGNGISIVTVGHFEASDFERDAQGQVRYGPAIKSLQNKREEFRYNTECLQKVVRVIGRQRVTASSVLIGIPRETTHEPEAVRPARASPGHRQSGQGAGDSRYPW